MTDSVLVFPPGFRVLDANGAPVSGAKIKFYEVGPGDPKTVHSDAGLSVELGTVVYTRADGYPVVSQGSNTTALIYVGSDPYYIVITDANDVAIFPAKDNVKGAVDTSDFLTTGAVSTLSQPVLSKTGPYTAVLADKGKLINANPSGGSFTITLDAAATLGDGWSIKIKQGGASNNVVTIAATEPIGISGISVNQFALGRGASVELICDGSTFKAVLNSPPYSRGPFIFPVVSRVSSAPGSPTAGARYIVSAGFSTYSTGDVIEATGVGFNVYTPLTDCGWVAYVQDENTYYGFEDSAWVALFPQSSDTVAGLIELAVQSEMETATDVVRAVTPGRQHFHPGHPKAWVRCDSSGNIVASYGVASVSHPSTGTYNITLATALSASTAYAAVSAPAENSDRTVNVTPSSTTVVVVTTQNASSVGANTAFAIALFGDF